MNNKPQLARAASRRLGRLIRQARERKGWTQADLADAIECEMEISEVPINYVSWLENGPPRPLADPVRFAGAIWSVGLTWKDALTALGLWDGMGNAEREMFETKETAR